MDIVLKDLVYFFVVASGGVAYVVASKMRTSQNERQILALREEHKENIDKIEENHQKEIERVIERLNAKKAAFTEFKEAIHKEIAELKKCASKCLDNERAEAKFVTKTELKLMMDNMQLKLNSMDEKIDILIARIDRSG